MKTRFNWGKYEDAVVRGLKSLYDTAFFDRILKNDPLIWKDDPSHHKEIRERLGWIRAPKETAARLSEVREFVTEVKAQKYVYAVLLGMGGSSLAPEVFQTVFGNKPGHPKLVILDSTDPRRVADVDKLIAGKKTLFIVSSKSGSTIELTSLFKHFYAKAMKANGDQAGRHFIAITDPGTALERLGRENRFRHVFVNAPDVGGRFSALTLFGIVPAALIGVDVEKVLKRAEEAANFTVHEMDPAKNPASDLGISMAALAKAGRDKLTFVTAREWECFGDWAEQLVAESTGKENLGVVPIPREKLLAPGKYRSDRYFVGLVPAGPKGLVLKKKLAALEAKGHPTFTCEIKDDHDLGAQFFLWEMATAVAGAYFKTNPFDQPNVQEAKDCAKRLLADVDADTNLSPETGKLTPVLRARAAAGVSKDMGKEWTAFWRSVRPGDYVNVLAFVPDRPTVRKPLLAVQDALRAKLGAAVVLGIGPRYLHSTGQLHKGGANNGVFLVVAAPAKKAENLPVPGEKFSFGQLELAQARGDFDALAAKGRRAFYVELADVSAKSLGGLVSLVKKI
jgi:transaldolase/glucose-6-phosphate isomerase